MPRSDLTDFTLSNTRRFYSSKRDPSGVKGLTSTVMQYMLNLEETDFNVQYLLNFQEKLLYFELISLYPSLQV